MICMVLLSKRLMMTLFFILRPVSIYSGKKKEDGGDVGMQTKWSFVNVAMKESCVSE